MPTIKRYILDFSEELQDARDALARHRKDREDTLACLGHTGKTTAILIGGLMAIDYQIKQDESAIAALEKAQERIEERIFEEEAE